MTLVLQLTDAQTKQLQAKAAQADKDPAAYLLSAAGIEAAPDDTTPPAPLPVETQSTGTAYDLFKDLLGGWSSNGSNLSEATGEVFAEGMAEKRRQGHL